MQIHLVVTNPHRVQTDEEAVVTSRPIPLEYTPSNVSTPKTSMIQSRETKQKDRNSETLGRPRQVLSQILDRHTRADLNRLVSLVAIGRLSPGAAAVGAMPVRYPGHSACLFLNTAAGEALRCAI